MSHIKSFRDLNVWNKGIQLVCDLYKITNKYPKEEIYGIVSQMQRAAVSIPSNIAEGATRKSKKEYYRFVSISYASSAELETQIEISKRLNYINQDEYIRMLKEIIEIQKMLFKLRESFKDKIII